MMLIYFFFKTLRKGPETKCYITLYEMVYWYLEMVKKNIYFHLHFMSDVSNVFQK